MRIFITGASGFIGNALLPLLEGNELLCLAQTTKDIPKMTNVHPLMGDLSEPYKWKSELKRFAPEWCIHLAWDGLPDYSLSRCRANLNASLELIEILADAGIKCIVVAGSCWEYGNVSGAVKEKQPVNNCNLFGSTKRSLQMMLESVVRNCGIEYRWGRIFFVYGPNQRTTSLIPQCYESYSNGLRPEIRSPNLAQDFVYIDDVASGIVAITKADIESGVYNIGSGVPTTVGYVANRIAEHFDKPALFSMSEPITGFWADTSKITAATGWQAKTTIDDGISKTLKGLGR